MQTVKEIIEERDRLRLEVKKLRDRLDGGHRYLATVETGMFSADEAFEAFGWTADGLNLMPWADTQEVQGECENPIGCTLGVQICPACKAKQKED